MSNIIINGENIDITGAPNSGAKFIYSIAHAYHSAQATPDSLFSPLVPTDKEGHNELLRQIESVEIFLNDGLNGVGEALAMSNELDAIAIKKLGFLISGLTDLQALVTETRQRVERSLKLISDQA